MEEEIIFNKLEELIKLAEIDNYNLYKECKDDEKLKVTQNSNNSLSFKVLKNYILLKFNKMKKINDTIELKIINDLQLENLKKQNRKCTL